MRLLSMVAVGLAAAGLSLVLPETSRAQSFSLNFGHGRGISFSSGYPTFYHQHNYGHGYGHGGYGHGGYGYGGYGYGGYTDGYGHRSYSHSPYGYDHGYYHQQRPVIVQPDFYHWTPDRGYHSHGQVLVPHRGHYHVRPY